LNSTWNKQSHANQRRVRKGRASGAGDPVAGDSASIGVPTSPGASTFFPSKHRHEDARP
jgi:hypothetical protein